MRYGVAVRTIKAAATALTSASTVNQLAAIARDLGFAPDALPLDRTARDVLGLPSGLGNVHVVRGPGELRALLAECHRGDSLRDAVTRTASRLTARAPHMLWLLLLVERGGSGIAIAAWSASHRSVRVAALVADRNRILDSDAETVCALVAAASPTDLVTHMRWLEVLGRDSLTRRFYLTLRDLVVDLGSHAAGPGDAEERREVALLYVSRLLFLSFLEAKGWLDGDRGFLGRSFERICDAGGGYEQRVLRPLFFGTLNTRVTVRAPVARAFGRIPFLNGGLFTPTPLERRLRALRFGDEQLGRLFSELLGRYRFTAREDSVSWSEAAIDPEMLGKSFESLMAAPDRKDSGAFYTPQSLVERVTRSALVATFAGKDFPEQHLHAALDGVEIPRTSRAAMALRLDSLTVLDPACGSGAFLVHMLAQLATLKRISGDDRPLATIRRDVLATSIFGVDLNRTAVWLCELRLWLAVVIEGEETDPMRVSPLPNLDHHIRVGDTLLGGDFTAAPSSIGDARSLCQLRLRYARSSGNRKRILSRALDHRERQFARHALETAIASVRAKRREILVSHRGTDLFGERRRPDPGATAALADLRARSRELRTARRRLDDGSALPFSFTAHFPDVAASGGFGILIGNPPWVRLHRIPARTRELLRRDYSAFRNAAWRDGAAGARAGSGFASQVDLAALFTERSLSLLREGGGFAMLLPSKLWRTLAGGGIRALVRKRSHLLRLEEWSDSTADFDAAVYPSLLVVRRSGEPPAASLSIAMAEHARSGSESWCTSEEDLGVRSDSAAPWLILPPEARRAFRQITEAGIPLCETLLGRPTLGVKCGLNDAFVLTVTEVSGDRACVTSAGRTGEVEVELLRPALRGGSLRAWQGSESREFVLWTHDALGRPLARLPRHAGRWLAGWRSELAARSDAQRSDRWWSLYRTEAASNDRPRVVWSDFGKTPRANVLLRHDRTVPLNSCYVCRCPDDEEAYALCALLNSPVAAAWLNAIAEPARGGFHRYLAWTISMMPIPSRWNAAREILAPIARAAITGSVPDPDLLLDATLAAYRLDARVVAPLIQWMRR